MINSSVIKLYFPQRVFLIQGNQTDFEFFRSDLSNDVQIVNTLVLTQLKVEHARIVSKFCTEGGAGDRFMLVYFSNFSIQAAEILLKSLEEPAENTTIIFFTPYIYLVPITIRSRAVLIHSNEENNQNPSINKKKALDFIKNELSQGAEEEAATKKSLAISFLDQLELQCRKNRESMEIIYKGKRMLLKSNLPVKFVVEYVASLVL